MRTLAATAAPPGLAPSAIATLDAIAHLLAAGYTGELVLACSQGGIRTIRSTVTVTETHQPTDFAVRVRVRKD